MEGPPAQRPMTRQTKRNLEEEKITSSLPAVPVAPPVLDPGFRHQSLPQPLRVISPVVGKTSYVGASSSLASRDGAPLQWVNPALRSSSTSNAATQIIPFMQISSNCEAEPALAIWGAVDRRLLACNERFLRAVKIPEENIDDLKLSLSDLFHVANGLDAYRELLAEVQACSDRIAPFFESVTKADGSVPPIAMRLTLRRENQQPLQFSLSMVSLQGEPRVLWILEDYLSVTEDKQSPIEKKRRQHKPWSAAVAKFSLPRPKTDNSES